jgi:hypothetical protein
MRTLLPLNWGPFLSSHSCTAGLFWALAWKMSIQYLTTFDITRVLARRRSFATSFLSQLWAQRGQIDNSTYSFIHPAACCLLCASYSAHTNCRPTMTIMPGTTSSHKNLLGFNQSRTRPFRRTRTLTEVRNSDSDLRNRDFPTPWPKIWNFEIFGIFQTNILIKKYISTHIFEYLIFWKFDFFTSLQYKCVNKQTRWVRVRRVFKVRNFRTRTSEKSADSDSDVRKALASIKKIDDPVETRLKSLLVFTSCSVPYTAFVSSC